MPCDSPRAPAAQIELAVPDARNQSALWGTAEQRQQQPSFGRGLHTNSAWLRHLLDSREVIIMPAPNADGFYRVRARARSGLPFACLS